MKLKILGIKPAVSKKDKIYWKVSTSQGNMTAFDEDIVKELGQAIINDKELNLNVVDSEKDGIHYMNIRGFAMDDDKAYDTPAKQKRYDEDSQQYEDMNPIKPQEFAMKEPVLEAHKRGMKALMERKSVKGSAYEKDPVGLAVEVWIAMNPFLEKNELDPMEAMEKCCKIVKQAQEAFS